MSRRLLVGVLAAVLGILGSAPWVLAQTDPRCEKRPDHPQCVGSTTSTPPGTTTTAPPGPTTSTTAPGAVTIAVVGDVGSWDHSADTLATAIGTDGLFVVGDLSYGGDAPEEEWCDFVKGVVGEDFPVEVLVGNHEAFGGDSGDILAYAECLPDKLGAQGLYGVQYTVDLGPLTFIGIAAKLTVAGVGYSYEPGSEERVWLEGEIDAARGRGDWVMIGVHKLCVTAGGKSCQLGEELSNFLIDGADVIVSGHEHTYQRTHPLTCVVENFFDEACLAADGEDGTIWVINGSGGRNFGVSADDEEAGYFAAMMGNSRWSPWGYGTSHFTITDDAIVGTYVCGGTCEYTDTFTMTR